jgi:DNA primase catalytic core
MSTNTIRDYLRDMTNLVNIIDIAEEYLTLDEHQRYECFELHDEDQPMLQFDEETQSFYCLDPNCRFHGGPIELMEALEGVSYIEAVNLLANRTGLDAWYSDRSEKQFGVNDEVVDKVRACLNAAARFYAQNLDKAIPYLERRGISRTTAEKYLIGATAEKNSLVQALEAQGFEKRYIALAGLFNRNGEDFFQDRIIVPIRVNGMVISFYGRALDDENTVKHLRMKKDSSFFGHGLFNWDDRREEIIAVEGIFDALALIDKGFSGAVATFGTQGLSSGQNQETLTTSRVKRVSLCFDGDPAGRSAAIKEAGRLEDAGLTVRIVDLGDGDPNEFMLIHSADDFQRKLSEACSLADFVISTVDPEWSAERKIEALHEVLSRCKRMKPLEQAATIDRIAELGFSKRVLRQHIAQLPDEHSLEKITVDLAKCLPVHPALDFVNGNTFMTVPQLVMDPDKGQPQWEPWVVTSSKEFFPLSAQGLIEKGYYPTAMACADEPRYSQQALEQFLQSNIGGDLMKTYTDILQTLRYYLDFPDPNTFAYLTAWIVGTYFHPIFNYYPYLHFSGTKNVGKSKTMKLMSCLCFNGTMSVSISNASQFRIIEALRPTLFLDESEDLDQKVASEKRALLLGGYEAGSAVLRTEKEGDAFKVKRMGNYGPRAFASIEGLDDTLASRTVQIEMKRSYEAAIKEREVNLKSLAFQSLRDDLFLVTMTCRTAVRDIYHTLEKPGGIEFGDREYNLFKPILAIGRATGRDEVVNALIDFGNSAYERKVAQYNETAEENVLLRFLNEAVTKDDWYRSDELHARFIEFLRSNGLEMLRVITKPRFGQLLHKLNLISDNRRSPDRRASIYYVRKNDVSMVSENYMVV